MMTFHFFQGCMYRVRLEEMTWIPSSNMKIMLAPQPDNIPDVDVGIIGGAAFVRV